MKLSNENQMTLNIVPLFGAQSISNLTGLLFLYERKKNNIQKSTVSWLFWLSPNTHSKYERL